MSSERILTVFEDGEDIELTDEPPELRVGDTIRSLESGELREAETDE